MDRRRLLLAQAGSQETIEPTYDPNYLTFIALEDNFIVNFYNRCSYSIDGGNWVSLSGKKDAPAINTGQTIAIKATNSPTSTIGCGYFTLSGKCKIGGNVMSMLFGDNAETNRSLSGKNYAFYNLFRNCTSIVDASRLTLPATTLSNYCYAYMFQGCTSLIAAPELPAVNLNSDCYTYMFQRCTSLIAAPDLPATSLVTRCYNSMFYGCTNLQKAPVLPATTLVSRCYDYLFYNCGKIDYIKALFTTTPSSSYCSNWVSGVASSGTFVKSKSATWNVTGTSGVPSGWTIIKE